MEKKKQTSKCPVSAQCGACQMIDVPYPEQIRRKTDRLKELLGAYGRIEPFVTMETPEHYRCKVHAVFDHGKQGRQHRILTGIYQEGTHSVVPVESCLLEDARADAIIATVRELADSFKLRAYDEDNGFGLLRHILIRTGHHSGEILVVLVVTSPVFPSRNNFVKALRKAHPEITTIVQNVNSKRTSMILGDQEKVLYGKGYIVDELCGLNFKISPKSFYQVNPVQAERLYRLAVEMASLTGGETVVECYSGVGTIGILMAAQAGEVISVELNRDAVRDARANARMNQVSNITFYENDATRFLLQMEEAGDRPDVVVLDPPRSGATAEFLDACLRLLPSRIVYISCSPDTLARDLGILCGDRVYRVERMVPVDMFPFTRGIEMACSLTLQLGQKRT